MHHAQRRYNLGNRLTRLELSALCSIYVLIPVPHGVFRSDSEHEWSNGTYSLATCFFFALCAKVCRRNCLYIRSKARRVWVAGQNKTIYTKPISACMCAEGECVFVLNSIGNVLFKADIILLYTCCYYFLQSNIISNNPSY